MDTASRIAVALALVTLAAEPAVWLARTWVEPGYDSQGGLVALLCVGLVIAAVRSGPAPADAGARRWAWALFAGAAALRLAGRLLDVHHVGALALVADVAGLGLALRLHRRPWPIHPGALAALFALSLPTEQLLQHVLGQPLRIASAAAAAWALGPFVPGLTRTGALLARPGTTVFVDLPCSGAQGLFLLGVAAWAIATRRRVGARGALLGTLSVLGGALVSNALRLAALVVGPTETLLAEPWHSAIGVAALAVGALPVFAVAAGLPRRVSRTAGGPRSGQTPDAQRPGAEGERPSPEGGRRPAQPAGTPGSTWNRLGAGLLPLVALGVTVAPHHPVDRSAPLPDLALPARVGDRIGEALPLSAQEETYFTRYGGAVDRRTYRGPDGVPQSALLIATTAPVRHLHGAGDCLRGAGHDVTRLGIREIPATTTIYRTVDPDGNAWRVASTLVSTDGAIVQTASEVVWRWMAAGGTWMRVERVTPWALCADDPTPCDDFDRALFAALDIPVEVTR